MLKNNTPQKQYQSFSGIEDYFKSTSWIGIGLGAVGLIFLVEYLLKRRKRSR